jgi:formate dehydrogenase major subunit
VPGLGASFGRGAATGFQRDLSNSDCIVIMGSNMAEAHPVGFRWPMKARERGATLVHVDPRFTRTSAMADVFVPIRAGTDIAFLGGIINYIIENDRWFKEYVLHYTNASFLLDDRFQDTEDLGGVFAGFDPKSKRYDLLDGAWGYKTKKTRVGNAIENVRRFFNAGSISRSIEVETDDTLRDPRCIFQVLKRHYARYTPAMVSQICGCRPEELIKVAELLCRNSGRERTSAFVYALGWTQHSTGVQMIRAAGIIQLLLGNVGRPGGGIMAMRGHCSIQGSTDIPTLYDLLPGYIPHPSAAPEHATLKDYLSHGRGWAAGHGAKAAGFWEGEVLEGYWANLPKLFTSLLKAWYGDAATSENEFGYQWLPKNDDDHSQLATFDKMSRGKVRGLFLIGQNPAAGAPNGKLNRAALAQLDWLVVRDWFEHESANFWYADPEVGDPARIKTEVFFIPAASIPEKEGTFTNTERLIQFHEKAIDPPGDCRSDTWFIFNLGRRLKAMYKSSTLKRDQPIQNLTWDFAMNGPATLPDGTVSRIVDEPDVDKIMQEINGRDLATGELLSGFDALKDDGSTTSGVWTYCGIYAGGKNRSKSRDPKLVGGWIYPDWAYSWPANRRVMYNRASADPGGKPWSERKKLIWWDETQHEWTGYDVPDFKKTTAPSYRPNADARGLDAIRGDAPFIMHPDGRGWLYAPHTTKDGPLPTHYEPRESPIRNALYEMQWNPTLNEHPGPLNPLAPAGDPKYPVVATTHRLTEHYLSGPMSRFNSWLNELQPEMFVEMSPELAEKRGIEHSGWCTIITPRAKIEARAMVTRRIQPLQVGGKMLHQIGLPIHWGYAGETVGAIANDLVPLLTDLNVSMHEAKAFACEVRAGRLINQNHGTPLGEKPRPFPSDPIPDTPEYAQPEGRQQPRREKNRTE